MGFLFFGLFEGVHIFFVALQLTLEVKVLSTLVAHHRLLLQRERIKIAKKWLKVTFLCILLRCWLRFVYFLPHSGHSNWNKIVFEVEDWFEGICHCHLVTFVNQPYVLPQITVLLSANRTWSAALEAKKKLSIVSLVGFQNLIVDICNVPLKICLQITAVAAVTALVFLQLKTRLMNWVKIWGIKHDYWMWRCALVKIVEIRKGMWGLDNVQLTMLKVF